MNHDFTPAAADASAAPDGDDWPDLVAAAGAGDERAWEALYAEYSGYLLRWLRTWPLGDTGIDHEDVAMETWAVAAAKIQQFHGSRSFFTTWLFRIARNKLMNATSRATRRATYAHAEVPDGAIDTDIAAQIDTSDAIHRAVAKLPRREAQVVTCVDLHDLDTARTASLLGTTRAVVTATRSRAVARLKGMDWDSA